MFKYLWQLAADFKAGWISIFSGDEVGGIGEVGDMPSWDRWKKITYYRPVSRKLHHSTVIPGQLDAVNEWCVMAYAAPCGVTPSSFASCASTESDAHENDNDS